MYDLQVIAFLRAVHCTTITNAELKHYRGPSFDRDSKEEGWQTLKRLRPFGTSSENECVKMLLGRNEDSDVVAYLSKLPNDDGSEDTSLEDQMKDRESESLLSYLNADNLRKAATWGAPAVGILGLHALKNNEHTRHIFSPTPLSIVQRTKNALAGKKKGWLV